MSIEKVFQAPGRSLLHNPFGFLECFIFGTFYPFNPICGLREVQLRVLDKISPNKRGYIFKDTNIHDGLMIDENIFERLEREILSSDMLFDVNVYFSEANSGLCVSHDDSLFLVGSANDLITKELSQMASEHRQLIIKSLNISKKWVKILSDPSNAYFSNVIN